MYSQIFVIMLKYFNSQSLERLSKLHKYILEEITGTPRELADKFNISERSIYFLIDWLKDNGAKINYDRKRKTYFYVSPFMLKVNFTIECISDKEQKIINGGFFGFPARILQGTTFPLLHY